MARMQHYTSSEPPQRPAIDRAELEHFLRLLDPNAKFFTIQTFTDREQKPNPDPLAKVYNISRFIRPVLDLYAQGAGVWVTINDTGGNGRKANAVTRIRAVGRRTTTATRAPSPSSRRWWWRPRPDAITDTG